MISPPEYNYRDDTLTLQATDVVGSRSLSGEVIIESLGSTQKPFTNPLSKQKIEVTVHSRYYRAWADYFETRMDSDVSVNKEQKLVTATLVPPPEDVTADKGLLASGDLSISGNPKNRISGGVSIGGTTNNKDAINGDVEENSVVARNITDASEIISSAKNRLSEAPSPPSDTITTGQYSTGSGTFETPTTFDTTNGDIEIYVDSELTKNDDISIEGDGDVNIYVDGVVDQTSNSIQWGSQDQVDSLTMYSQDLTKLKTFYGVFYTDAVDIQGGGNDPDIVGALISTDSVNLGSNVDIEYNESVSQTVVTEVEPEYPTVSYLHIGKSRIKVSNS